MVKRKGGMGSVGLFVRGAFASALSAVALTAGAVPAMAAGAGTLAADVDADRYQVAAAAASGNNGYNMAGARYNIYTDAQCTGSPVGVLTVVDNTGATNTVELTAGTYYVKETTPDLTKGFTGYRVSDEVHTINVQAGQTVTVSDATEPMISGTFSLEKGLANTGSTQVNQGDVTSLAGVEFKVEFWTYLYGSVEAAHASGAADCTVTMRTDEQGRITQSAFEDGSAIVSGTWKYQEGGRNVVPCGTVVVTETETNNAAFSVATAPVGYKVMDYYLDESTMRNSAAGPETVKYVKIANGSLTSTSGSILTVDEPMHFGGLKVTKVDANRDETKDSGESTPQGDADLVGITYRVSNESAGPVWVLDTCPGILEGSGTASYGGKTYVKFAKGADICEVKSRKLSDSRYGFDIGNVFPAGTYKVRETAGTGSYLASGWWRQWSFTADGYVQEYTTEQTDAEHQSDGWNADQVVRGGVSVYKDDEDLNESYAQGNATLGGAEFTVTNQSQREVYVDGKWRAKGADVGTITTNDDGLAQSDDHWLPYGTYSIRETVAPEGYDLDEDWTKTFTVREDGAIVALGHAGPDDPVKRGGLSVQKQDAETGSNDPQGNGTLEGTEYTVTNRSAHDVVVNGERKAPGEAVLVLTTDADGHAETEKDALPVGKYEIRETKAPEGYTLDEKWSETVTITPADQGKIVAVKHPNKDVPIRAGFTLGKVDAIFGGTPSGDGTLEGAEITVTNRSKHRIMTSDGEWVQPGQDIHMKLYSDEDGVFRTPDRWLPYGTYELRETKAPAGYEVNEDWSVKFEVGPDDDGRMIELGEDGQLPETPQPYPVKLRKVDADRIGTDSDGAQGTGTFEGVEFTIVNASDNAISYKGETVEPGKVVTVVITNADGYTDVIRLPYGTYKVYESAAPEGYLLNEHVYRLTLHDAQWELEETSEVNPAL